MPPENIHLPEAPLQAAAAPGVRGGPALSVAPARVAGGMVLGDSHQVGTMYEHWKGKPAKGSSGWFFCFFVFFDPISHRIKSLGLVET